MLKTYIQYREMARLAFRMGVLADDLGRYDEAEMQNRLRPIRHKVLNAKTEAPYCEKKEAVKLGKLGEAETDFFEKTNKKMDRFVKTGSPEDAKDLARNLRMLSGMIIGAIPPPLYIWFSPSPFGLTYGEAVLVLTAAAMLGMNWPINL